MKSIFLPVIVVSLVVLLGLGLFTQPAWAGIFSGQRPNTLGVQAGQLAPCPASPNCVSSQSGDGSHRIEPLRPSGSIEEAFTTLKQVVQSQPRTKVVSASEDYLYVEFTSRLMGFVDDVEFYVDREAGVIQVRSASRLGESDLGVNRDRIETLRQALQNQGSVA
ncbi:DUF1499 domain-containing protein [Alkalinema sp. FACHB-956]|uniref:DUF1499 domain-containing protein n=1 Tax=Alkalinema sp. FACHB-956 TaxID=2692768 RepID=UPI00168681C7|nr:DUF1499 domain-containing protein [Alkalinema sp. FACHB-956]MBD2329647.1 DUF1499 domain-containing protein [Alkalinema sp. FACHB-956]